MTYSPKHDETIQGPSSRKTGAGVKFQEDLHIHSFFFYKNIFYKNIEAEICEILRIF